MQSTNHLIERAITTGHEVLQRAEQLFGTASHGPNSDSVVLEAIDDSTVAIANLAVATDGDIQRTQAIAQLSGIREAKAMPGSRLVDIAANREKLASLYGYIFGLLVDRAVVPAVITARSTPGSLHLTYLSHAIDRLHPANPVIETYQRALLQKATQLQQPNLGTHLADGAAAGAEFGHQAYGSAALLRPSLLNGSHMVHHWAEDPGGIEGNIANDNLPLFDVTSSNGKRRPVRFSSTTFTAGESGVLIDHNSYYSPTPLKDDEVQSFTLGLGIVAVTDQLGTQKVQETLLTNLEKLSTT